MSSSPDWPSALPEKNTVISKSTVAGNRIVWKFQGNVTDFSRPFQYPPFFGVIVIAPVGQHLHPTQVMSLILYQRPAARFRIHLYLFFTEIVQRLLMGQRDGGNIRMDHRAHSQIVVGYPFFL